MLKKSGFVALVGRSNVGKSTLLNTVIGTKVAITTPKPQTTRLPVQGVLSEDRGQMVFVDTPGVYQKAGDALSSKLREMLEESLHDIDAIVYVADPTREIGREEKAALALIRDLKVPKILVINKSDLLGALHADFYRDLGKEFSHTLELSALTGANVNWLVDWLFEVLPEGEPHYPIGQFTNLSNEQWIAELIREKLFLRLRQEVPYSVHVQVEELTRREDGTLYIRGVVYTSDERYKRMIIGRKGQGIKEIGQSTRNELQAVMQQKIYLDLEVQTDAHWVERL